MTRNILILALLAIFLQIALSGFTFKPPGPSDYTREGFTTSAKRFSYDQFFRHEHVHNPDNLKVTVTYDSETEFTVRIADSDRAPRYEMPHEAPFPHTKTTVKNHDQIDYEVHFQENGWYVKRKSTGEVIFDNTGNTFFLSELYSTMTTRLPSRYLYGLGERNRDFLYESGQYTIWNKDAFAAVDYGHGNEQTYGSHPVYLMREGSGNWHMVYLRTTNALDVWFDSNAKTLRYEMTGDFIEFKFFLGGKKPDTAIKQYHHYIGGWAIQPFWSLGYHQSKWGYLYLDDLKNVANKMKENGLPMDVLWSDIDYMKDFIDFTIDEQRYNIEEFRKFTEEVHWVPIIDAGVFLDPNTEGTRRGNELNVWMKSAYNNSNPLVGIVWPGLVNYPDWLSPNCPAYWTEMLKLVFDKVPFSGLWLDMNENADFCDGEYNRGCFVLPNYIPKDGRGHIYPHQATINPIPLNNMGQPPIHDGVRVDQKIIDFDSGKLPYVPGGKPLDGHSISINALHHGNVMEFDFHNLNPFYEAKITYDAVAQISKKRPFLLTRSNTVGAGQFAAHWTGDNLSSWTHLRLSIAEIFNNQLFGIPMVGADICGFGDDTTVELCSRWMQLGAFYPFMRNHNKIDSIDQEPYALGPVVLSASKASLRLRYSILKYYYSIFAKNKQIGTIFRPVFFDYPEDESIMGLQNQFLIGSDLMVAAIVNEGQYHTQIYFPANTKWFKFNDGIVIQDQHMPARWNHWYVPLDYTLPVFIRGGSIVHTQNVDNVLRSADLNNHFNLVVALQQSTANTYTAEGQMMGITDYKNDGSVDTCFGDHDCLVNIEAKAIVHDDSTVSVTVNFSQNMNISTLEEIFVDSMTFYGVRTKVCEPRDTSCADEDHVVTCKLNSPHTVQYGKVEYVLRKDSCTPVTSFLSK